jgi:tape measure domain-containing protein
VSVVANVAINVDATKAVQQLKAVDAASKGIEGGLNSASVGAKGLGAALTAALGPIAAIGLAVEGFRRATEAAFGRAQAETRLKALSAAYGENAQTAAMAASASEKFGLTQTEASQAIADVYGRLRPLGFGLKEVNGVYEGFNVLSKQAALSSAEASTVFTQLSQALGSGVLRGDEFNRMAESMPSILGAVSKELGVSQTQLRGMAAEGKITSEVVVKALQGVAESGGDLNKFLDPSTIAMNNLRKNTEEMFVQIGKLFGPAVVAGMNFLSTAIQKVAEGWQYFSGVLLPKLLEALSPIIEAVKKVTASFDFETIIDAIQGGMIIAINGMTFAVEKLAPIVGFVIKTFAQLAQNPVFKFIAEQVGRLVTHLGEARGGIDEYKAKQAETTKGAMDLVKQSSQLPPKIEEAKEKAKQLKEAQDAVTKAIKKSSEAIDKSVAAQVAGVDRVLSVTNARIEAEKAINNVLLEQAQRQLDGALNQEERVKAAGRILNVTIEQARLERDAAYASIEAEKIKLDIAVAGAKLKEKEVRLAVELARIQGKALAEHYDTLNAATQLVDTAIKQRDAASEAAKYQMQAADASFKGAESAAKAAYQGNIAAQSSASLASNTNSAAEAAGQYAGSMQSAAAAMNAIDPSKTVGFIPATGGAFTASGGAGGIKDEAKRIEMMNLFNQINARNAQLGVAGRSINDNELAGFSARVQDIIKQENTPITPSISNPSQERLEALMAQTAAAATGVRSQNEFQAFAKGGVVTKPTMAMVGEGGEDEYIIPASKMQEAMKRYADGKRGDSVIPTSVNPQVSVTTGPVMNMDGRNYVSQQDFMAGLQTASRRGAEMALSTLSNSYSARRAAGIA